MGGAQSKSESMVESIVNAGVSVLKDTVNDSQIAVTNENIVTIKGCKGFTMTGNVMKNYSILKMSSIIEAMSDVNVQQDISKAMAAQTQSIVEGGIGWTSSQADAVIKSSTNLSTTIRESVSNLNTSDIKNKNEISCEDSEQIVIKKNKMENVSKSITEQITKSESVTAAMQKLQEDLEAAGVSKAKGFNPTALIFLIVAVIAFFFFGGIGMVAKTLLSASFWMLVAGAFTGFSIYMVISSWTGTWPGNKPPTDWPVTNPTEIAEKEAEEERVRNRNKSVRKWGLIMAAGGAVATTGFAWAVSKTNKPKTIRQTIVAK